MKHRGYLRCGDLRNNKLETLTDLMFEVDGAIEEDREARRPAHLVLKKLARGRGVRELYRQQHIGYRQLWRAASMRGTYLNRLCGIDNQSAGG